MEAETALFCPLFAKLDVLFDLVIEVIHRIPSVSHPVVAKTFWTGSLVLQIRVPELTKCMVPGFVHTCVSVDVPKFLQRRMQVATNEVGRRQRFSILALEQESAGASADELSQQSGYFRMEVYLSKSTCSLQAILHFAVACLLVDGDGGAVTGKMLVYFDPKQFSNT